MKKWIIAGAVTAVIVLIALSAFLLVQFLDLAGTAGSQDSSAPAVEDYARTHLADFDCAYDGATLILSQKTTLNYESACAYGGSIYTDELAPETYLPQVQSIRADVLSNCQLSALEVELRYLTTEGKILFSVSSTGSIQTCWEDSQ